MFIFSKYVVKYDLFVKSNTPVNLYIGVTVVGSNIEPSIPTLSVLDSALPPLYKDEPKRKKILLMHILFGVMIGVTVVFGQFWYNQFFIKIED